LSLAAEKKRNRSPRFGESVPVVRRWESVPRELNKMIAKCE
jgi:hypothetical protein